MHRRVTGSTHSISEFSAQAFAEKRAATQSAMNGLHRALDVSALVGLGCAVSLLRLRNLEIAGNHAVSNDGQGHFASCRPISKTAVNFIASS